MTDSTVPEGWAFNLDPFWDKELNGGKDWREFKPGSNKKGIFTFCGENSTYSYNFSFCNINKKLEGNFIKTPDNFPPHLGTVKPLIPGENDLLTTAPEVASRLVVHLKSGETNPKNIKGFGIEKCVWKCENNSNHTWEKPIREEIRYKTICKECSSFAQICPDVVDVWSKENSFSPYEILSSHRTKVAIDCPNHLEPYYIMPYAYKAGQRCGICKGKQVSSYNSFRNTAPKNIVDEYFPINGDPSLDEVTLNSAKSGHWKCTHCNKIWKATFGKRAFGRGCPKCNWGLSSKDLIEMFSSVEEIFDSLSLSAKYSIVHSMNISTARNYGTPTQKVRDVLIGHKSLKEAILEWKSEDSATTPESEDLPVEEEFTSGLEGLEEDDSDILMGIGGADALMSEDELDAQIHGIGEALDKGRAGVGKADELVEFLISSFVAEKWKAEFAK